MDRSRSTRQGHRSARDEYNDDVEYLTGRPIPNRPRRESTRGPFRPSFRSAAYPSGRDPFSYEGEEPSSFQYPRSTHRHRADSFSKAEDEPFYEYRSPKHRHRADSFSKAEDEPFYEYRTPKHRHRADSFGEAEDEPFYEYRSPKHGYDTPNSFSEEDESPRGHRYHGKSSRKYGSSWDDLRGEWFMGYEPHASFDDVRGEVEEPDDGSSSASALTGVDMYVVAMIFIGISVTFRHIPERYHFALMETFLRRHHPKAAGNLDQWRIEEVYEWMAREKVRKNYHDLDTEKVREFEEETGLSRFRSNVRFEDEY